MKRRPSLTKDKAKDFLLEREQQAAGQSRIIPPSLLTTIEARFDFLITLEKRNNPTTSFNYPQELFFAKTAHLGLQPTTIAPKSYFSSLAEKYVDYLSLTYKIVQYNQVVELFGDRALSERRYPDSKGEIDFLNCKGGKLLPQASSHHPALVTFNTLYNEIKIDFYFSKVKKVKNEVGEWEWKTII